VIRFIRVKTEGPFPGERSFRRKHNAAMKAGHRTMGQFWIHGGIRERHFLPQAHFVYHYAQRAPGYMKRKQAKYGHNIDLVWTGESMRQTSYSRVVPTAFRALMRIPSGQFNRLAGRIDARDELLRLTDDDRQQMAGAFQSAYNVELVRQRGGTITIIRGAAA